MSSSVSHAIDISAFEAPSTSVASTAACFAASASPPTSSRKKARRVFARTSSSGPLRAASERPRPASPGCGANAGARADEQPLHRLAEPGIPCCMRRGSLLRRRSSPARSSTSPISYRRRALRALSSAPATSARSRTRSPSTSFRVGRVGGMREPRMLSGGCLGVFWIGGIVGARRVAVTDGESALARRGPHLKTGQSEATPERTPPLGNRICRASPGRGSAKGAYRKVSRELRQFSRGPWLRPSL